MSFCVKFNGNSRARVGALYKETSQYKSPDHDYREADETKEMSSVSESTSAHSSFNSDKGQSPNSAKSASPSSNFFDNKPIFNGHDGRTPNSDKSFFDKMQSSNSYGFSSQNTEKGNYGNYRRESSDSGHGSNSPNAQNGIDGPWEHDLFDALEEIVPSKRQPKVVSRGPSPIGEQPMAPTNNAQNAQPVRRVVHCNLVPANLMFRLRVNQLPLDISEEDIQKMFEAFNHTRIRTYRDDDGYFNGNADVFFSRLPDAEMAYCHYKGAMLDGQRIWMDLGRSTAEDIAEEEHTSNGYNAAPKTNFENYHYSRHQNAHYQNNYEYQGNQYNSQRNEFARQPPHYRNQQQMNFTQQNHQQNLRSSIWSSGRVTKGPSNDRQGNFVGNEFSRPPPNVASNYRSHDFDRRPNVSPVAQMTGQRESHSNVQEAPKKELPNLFKKAMEKAKRESPTEDFFSIRELTSAEKERLSRE